MTKRWQDSYAVGEEVEVTLTRQSSSWYRGTIIKRTASGLPVVALRQRSDSGDYTTTVDRKTDIRKFEERQ